MDQERLEKIIGAAKNRLGVSITKDDPLFALVVLNEAVLTDAIESALARIEPLVHAIYEAEKTVPSAVAKIADEGTRLERAIDSVKANVDKIASAKFHEMRTAAETDLRKVVSNLVAEEFGKMKEEILGGVEQELVNTVGNVAEDVHSTTEKFEEAAGKAFRRFTELTRQLDQRTDPKTQLKHHAVLVGVGAAVGVVCSLLALWLFSPGQGQAQAAPQGQYQRR